MIPNSIRRDLDTTFAAAPISATILPNDNKAYLEHKGVLAEHVALQIAGDTAEDVAHALSFQILSYALGIYSGQRRRREFDEPMPDVPRGERFFCWRIEPEIAQISEDAGPDVRERWHGYARCVAFIVPNAN